MSLHDQISTHYVHALSVVGTLSGAWAGAGSDETVLIGCGTEAAGAGARVVVDGEEPTDWAGSRAKMTGI
jgi:hypothetical protein